MQFVLDIFFGGGDFAGDSNDSQYSARSPWHHSLVSVYMRVCVLCSRQPINSLVSRDTDTQ